jgi:hypothetical protein
VPTIPIVSYGEAATPRPVTRTTSIRFNVCFHSTTAKGFSSPFKNNSCRKTLHILANDSARRASRSDSATLLSS